LEKLAVWCSVPAGVIGALLTGCRGLTEFNTYALDADNCLVMATMCGRLMTLEINEIRNSTVGTLDEKVATIANLSCLRKLHITFSACCEFSSAMENIARSCSMLVDVTLHLLPNVCAVEFARHCPAMTHFCATLNDPVSPELLNAIAHGWPHLRRLLLERNVAEPDWTDAHDTALVDLISRSRVLTQLVCISGKSPLFISPIDIRDRYAALEAFNPSMSALRLLWVTRLSASALSAILACCPLLCEITHVAPAQTAFLHTLAASCVKEISFCGAALLPSDLKAFRSLRIVQVWDIAQGMENALVGIATRSPGLERLTLTFRERPKMDFFPSLLRHAAALVELTVERVKGVGDGIDTDSSGEDEEGGVVNREFEVSVAGAMKTFADLLCPSLEWVSIVF
jgi:hypothetical protein